MISRMRRNTQVLNNLNLPSCFRIDTKFIQSTAHPKYYPQITMRRRICCGSWVRHTGNAVENEDGNKFEWKNNDSSRFIIIHSIWPCCSCLCNYSHYLVDQISSRLLTNSNTSTIRHECVQILWATVVTYQHGRGARRL